MKKSELSKMIREEIKTAKGPAKAIELGYEKALSAILDANVTTFLTAIIPPLPSEFAVTASAVSIPLTASPPIVFAPPFTVIAIIFIR